MDIGAAYTFLSNGSSISSTAQWTWYGQTAGDRFGYSVALGLFSVVDTPYLDLAVGAPYWNSPISGGEIADVGIVYLYAGDGTGITFSTNPNTNYGYDRLYGGNLPVDSNERFGTCLLFTDRLDSNARRNLVIGAPGYHDSTYSEYGRVVIESFDLPD